MAAVHHRHDCDRRRHLRGPFARATKRGLDATQRGLDAQSQPLLVEVPRGKKLPNPSTIEGPSLRLEAKANFAGEIVVKPSFPFSNSDEFVLLASVPVRNVGPGVATITSARFTLGQFGALNFTETPKYVAPGQEVRLTVSGVVEDIDDQMFVDVKYTDFSGRTRWRTGISILAGSSSWDAESSRTKRL